MGRGGFSSIIIKMARDAARAQRMAEAQQRRAATQQRRYIRETERYRKYEDRLDKQMAKERHVEEQLTKTEDLNEELNDRIKELDELLEHTLAVNDCIDFKSLKKHKNFKAFSFPPELNPQPPPEKEPFFKDVNKASWLSGLLPGAKEKRQKALEAAEEAYLKAVKQYESDEIHKTTAKERLKKEYELEKAAYDSEIVKKNQEIDDFKRRYFEGEIEAIIAYNNMVLEDSDYPEGFPYEFQIGYLKDSKELVIEYEIPSLSIIPSTAEYKYNKSKNRIDEKKRKVTDIKEQYKNIVAAITLRTIHEVIEADQGNHIAVVVFNGFTNSVDPATGKDIRPYLISIRTSVDRFKEIDLGKIDKATCLRNLGAQVSPRPAELLPVKPIIDFNMIDKRFIDHDDVISSLDSRPNLMEMNPYEFENLVRDLFNKLGLESKLTRSSRDGGVDVVAFDLRPILGGKVVIQAKRYSNTVGVSAVRDLYGTMMNEGANKGILVTTSSYGPDAYDFSKDKPIELIDGGGLLYHLEQIGISARILFLTDVDLQR